MFTHYRTQGFILKKTDRGEADRIFTIYTKDFGKLELLAKAERKIKSKLRGGLELFYLSDIEFIQGKTHKTLTDAILINNFKNLKKNLKRLKIAYQISEVLDDLVKGQEPDEEIWQLLNETFERLDKLKIACPIGSPQTFLRGKLEIIYYYFFWVFLSILGYQPELYYCSLCQKKLTPEKIFFSPREGGLICGQCKDSVKQAEQVDADTAKIIRILIKKDWPILEKLKIEVKDLKQLSMVSNYYLSEILEQVQ